ncbi:hypothetical protein ARHIZOSPH14_19540 [Agromyces rhizosphaerae]|uniref:NERD domain-containing protein n=1 Tax=Agromyces rhizosphaerae TaxID=88374 RepID=A0A9W6CYT2_9MICO|nr:nuclease-related domain-containing protein [Agromyces rhizosphaerae]GLI27712.1 hypothetical protein ARHIZOSPH14_19540 [Agromyces rhizosphaerae]
MSELVDVGELAQRRPAASVIAECLREQASVPPNTAVQRFFGVSPVGRAAEPWYVGALGELEVARRLERLGDGWHVLHSVPVGTAGSDLDHVAIGPGGVFTINTKHHRGASVWVGARRILVNGQRTDHLRNAEHEANRTAKLLSTATRMPLEATPVLAIVGARRLTVRERPPRVVVLPADVLVRWLRRRPGVLAPEEVGRLVASAALPSTWGQSGGVVEADHDAFERLRREVGRARRRRMAWGGVVMAAAVAALVVAVGLALGTLVGTA